MKFQSLLLSVALALFGVQCSSTDNSGSGGAPLGASGSGTLTQVAALFAAKCTSCHGADPILPGVVDLRNDAGLYTRLTTPITTDTALLGPSCNGQVLVNKAMLTMSLLPKIVGSSPPCSTHMPDGCRDSSCATAEDVALIQSWINAGAPEK